MFFAKVKIFFEPGFKSALSNIISLRKIKLFRSGVEKDPKLYLPQYFSTLNNLYPSLSMTPLIPVNQVSFSGTSSTSGYE